MAYKEPQDPLTGKSTRHSKTASIVSAMGLGKSVIIEQKQKVYHGTDTYFTLFDKDFLGEAHGTAPINMMGFSFTDDIDVARSFGKRVIEAEVKIEKPYIIDAKGKDYSEFKHILNNTLEKVFSNEKVSRKKYDGIIILNYKDSGKYSQNTMLSNHYIPFKDEQITITDEVK